ncbi:MAG: DNA helicase UvrBC [Clostridiaceae bacterium]|jgi:protein arginine kinase activator|nr:DNA helicase UvrBC [Clostridiaceae bacterium]
MLCQICHKREATVHFTRIVNQQKVEMHVCERCAAENSEIKINIHNLLSGIMGIGTATGVGQKTHSTIKCEFCGMTINEFNKTGLLGCTKCYEVFGDSITTMLKRIHGNVKHHGKMPKNISSTIKDAYNLRSLKEELQRSINKEEYEKAAEIRDKIKLLEKSMQGKEG